jgi:anti-sigma B factor antagonist
VASESQEAIMECQHEDGADGVRIIRLTGRMDIEGTHEVALRFNALAVSGGPRVIVDLSGLEFLSSLGIATLVQGARTLRLRHGVLAVYGARSQILAGLERANIASIVPTCANLEEARARVAAPTR